ncbi:MAG: cupin domain-containing protein [Actinomycetota bacterium]|nr:cupin domain-containing protein [Actinomycetota bacterium]
MPGVQAGRFDAPDETRSPAKTKIDVVKMGDTTAARFSFEPGWKWSECIKPVAGTDSCQVRHVGVVHGGRLHVTHEDGSQGEVGPGDTYVIEPGHDAWVVGNEPFVAYEFESRSAEEYAKTTE